MTPNTETTKGTVSKLECGTDAFLPLREAPREQARIDSLMRLVPASGARALDVGARDGYLSVKLAERYGTVTALDLTMPRIEHPRVVNVAGNAASMAFPDASFDLILCAEVLEHIPSPDLEHACAEISRVAASDVVIGVPYREDIRVGRTTCRGCGKHNPPWGHVNSFDEQRLNGLFPDLEVAEVDFVGESRVRTNRLATWLMDRAGNPYGSYGQLECCTHCGSRMSAQDRVGLPARILASLALRITALWSRFAAPHGNWMHVRFRKPALDHPRVFERQ